VRILTAHAAKGLEWDLVAVIGVQEGVWPDLRLRGSLLGSEQLVDVAAGRQSSTAARLSALLDEERRLFYVATSRARAHLLVTAVDASTSGSGGEEQPSRFLHEIAESGVDRRPDDPAGVAMDDSVAGDVARGVLRRPMTLPALVAELRAYAADRAQPPGRRQAAATQLAELAGAAVAGADPDQWWGLRALSDDGALVGTGQHVRVSPSTVDSVLRCGLRWLLERHGGSEPPSAKQGIGNLVHAAAMLVEERIDPSAVRAFVSDRFGAIELPAVWLGDRERMRAEKMVDKFLVWLAENPRHQLAIEKEFECLLAPQATAGDVSGASVAPAALLKGRVDRLEMDEHGRLVVVDLKTGASAPTAEEAAAHPQLAAYQVAVSAGAFDAGHESGGAEIVALGTTSAKASVRVQAALGEAVEPGWARALVDQAAAAMAASAFRAVVNDSCVYCGVRTSCPVSGKGRQVTQ
jgi:RecB family exonuclease